MKITKYIALVAALFAATISQAQPFYGSVAQPVVSTSAGTKGVSGVAWTNAIAVATTNLTLISAAGTKDLALQFQANLMATNASSVTVVWALAKSVSGGSTTNLNGSPILLDQQLFVTNTIAVNTTASPVVTFNLASLPPASVPNGVGPAAYANKGAIDNIYVFSCTPSGGTVTNTTVYARGL